MKFLRMIPLIIAILFLLFCLAGSQRAWFGIIIFFVGFFLHKQYQKGRIRFSKSRYLIILGLLSAFILALTSPATTQPVKQTASGLKAKDTEVKADEKEAETTKKAEEEKLKEAEKKKEEAAAAKLAEQKKLEEARKEEEAKKQAEQKRLEEERKKKEQEQERAAALEAERKRKEQEAAKAKAAAKPAPIQSTETFDNCTEMRKVHPNGVPSTHPAYESQHDRDKDNWACER